MLRIMAAIAFAAAGGAAGFSMAARLRREQRVCAAICCLLERTAFLVGYRGDDVFSVFSELRRDPELTPLTFLRSLPESYAPGADLREKWRDLVRSQGLGEDECELLLRLGSIIGRSDCASQLDSIRQLRESAAELERRRDEVCRQKSRLYRSVGLLFGVMAAILVI